MVTIGVPFVCSVSSHLLSQSLRKQYTAIHILLQWLYRGAQQQQQHRQQKQRKQH
jgi:hypothetical protein